jgi:hypothetical protein
MTLLLGIIIFPIVNFVIYNAWTASLQNKAFQKYEVFSQKIIPENFNLVETQNHPSTMSEPTGVEQTFRVSSTRREIIEQLEPIFKQYGFRTYNDNTQKSYFHRTSPQDDNYDDRWYLNGPTTSILIEFFPDDTFNPPQPFPYKVEQVTIWWSCTVGVQACLEGKDLSL